MKDLLKLYSFESVHDTPEETALADWICKWLEKHNIFFERLGNNIYSLTGTNKTILSAHLDQVQTNGKAVKFFMQDDDTIRGYNSDYEQTSLGGDDKNGVWIILKALEAGKEIDFVISAGEEYGCLGIKALEDAGKLDEIEPHQICLVLDRKGEGDILKGGSTDVYCCTLAQDMVNYLGDEYKVTTGSISDTRYLCCYCESVNMSTAYYNPHSSTEYTDFKRLKEIRDDVFDIVDNFVHYSTDPVEYIKIAKTTTKKTKDFYTNYGYDDYDDNEWRKYYDSYQ